MSGVPCCFYCVPEEVVEGNSSAGHRLCPQGHYCPAGTGRNWTACPAGTFGARRGLEMESDCTDCPGGFYCEGVNLTAPTAECDPGYYCVSKVNKPNPTPTNASVCDLEGEHTGIGGICPPGYSCPGGSEWPNGCIPGTYQDQEGQDTCKSCPEGYYCGSNFTTYADTICPSGSYCPLETEYDIQYPCPEGSFNNLTGAHDNTWCVDCTPGMYCEGQGNSYPTDYCDEGWFCSGGANETHPSAPYGGYCVAGEYCPRGSSAPLLCDPGQYCDVDRMASPRGDCSAGYYCINGSTTATPTGMGGNKCSPGHYCVEGSSYEEPCPPGTYQPSQKAKNVTYCLDCLSGRYCNSSGLAQPEGLCSPGFYCPPAQTVPTPNDYICPVGHFCIEGSMDKQPCNSGTYQDEIGQWECKECPAGFYCDNSATPVVNYTAFVCPSGHYCPNGTRFDNEHACPIGTFNNITGLTAEEECSPCLGGYYCGQPGLVYPITPCSPGYYCRRSAEGAAPDQLGDANICPVGHYCPEGTTEPITCPAGTFSNDTGLHNVTECEPCTPGFYCDADGLIEPTAPCSAGFYCPAASTSSEQIICPPGKYCPLQTSVPYNCPNGTFSNNTRLEAAGDCTLCNEGWYCQTEGLTEPEGLCTPGYYCPTGSNNPTPYDCPIGLHCPEGSPAPFACASGRFTNRTRRSVCEICPPGYYCLPENETLSNPDLKAGYDDCPEGYYCPQGTGLDWQPCPAGTFSDQKTLFKITQCTDCSGGYYCSQESQTNVTAMCSPGYWCDSGVDRPNPNTDGTNSTYNATCPLLGGHTGVGGVCPRGYKCPLGTTLPLGCSPGTYQDQEGSSDCSVCPKGHYCEANATTYLDTPCPVGHFCPEGTGRSDEFPCPAGTFNHLESQTNDSSCVLCTGGMYCQGDGNELPTANCSEGWYCIEGASSPRPTDPSIGGNCVAGEYCPGMSVYPTPCDLAITVPQPDWLLQPHSATRVITAHLAHRLTVRQTT
ncbi:neurogenic locus notch homolog protein 1-like [Ptychodera flava]|uniref:neurogenic locus notch homolog protein 1-like n=1 Tax=Ptychodera flava TaxID=63121 RepID=UPI003969E97D